MTTKHTPGPWVVGPTDDTVVTHLGADGTRYEIAQIDGDYNQPETWPEMEANARLIAAAPDLLEALKRITEPAPGVARLPAWVYGIAVPAIAKATA